MQSGVHSGIAPIKGGESTESVMNIMQIEIEEVESKIQSWIFNKIKYSSDNMCVFVDGKERSPRYDHIRCISPDGQLSWINLYMRPSRQTLSKALAISKKIAAVGFLR